MSFFTYEVITYDYSGEVVEVKKSNTLTEAKIYFEIQTEENDPELSFDLVRIKNYKDREVLKSV